MKIREEREQFRKLGRTDLVSKVVELEEQLFNLDVRSVVGQGEQSSRRKKIRKSLARIKTVIKELSSNQS